MKRSAVLLWLAVSLAVLTAVAQARPVRHEAGGSTGQRSGRHITRRARRHPQRNAQHERRAVAKRRKTTARGKSGTGKPSAGKPGAGNSNSGKSAGASPSPGTTTTPIPPTPPGPPQPAGPAGNWQLMFDDEFDGSSLDTSKWVALNGWSTNGVVTSSANVSVANGHLALTLRSPDSGAEVDSSPSDGAGAQGYLIPVGGFAEARIEFPGDGASIYDWPAWWLSGPDWPSAGENDIAEGLGTLTANYHSNSGTHNQGTVPGVWTNGFHTYGVYRGANYCNVYYDGVLVKSYPTDDDGQPESLLINVGAGNTPAYGAASQVKIDYVRAWQPS